MSREPIRNHGHRMRPSFLTADVQVWRKGELGGEWFFEQIILPYGLIFEYKTPYLYGEWWEQLVPYIDETERVISIKRTDGFELDLSDGVFIIIISAYVDWKQIINKYP